MSELATEIPRWLKAHLSQEDLETIEKAVTKAEAHTTGEVVPMVVSRSSTVGHVPILLIFLLSLVFFGFDLHLWQQQWVDLPFLAWVLIDTVLLLTLVRFLSPLSFVERWLTSRTDQIEQVERRALNEFYDIRIHHTEKATGILIFVSLMEHQVVIIGDEGISQKISQEDWQQAIDLLLKGLKSKNLCQGFVNALDWSGEKLATHFPKTENNSNELKNHLVIKE